MARDDGDARTVRHGFRYAERCRLPVQLSCIRREHMLKNVRAQMIAMLAIGGLIGYAIASRQPELSSRSQAAEAAPAPIVKKAPAAANKSAEVCLTETNSKA